VSSTFCVTDVHTLKLTLSSQLSMMSQHATLASINNKKLIRRRDSERELFTTTSYTHYSPQ